MYSTTDSTVVDARLTTPKCILCIDAAMDFGKLLVARQTNEVGLKNSLCRLVHCRVRTSYVVRLPGYYKQAGQASSALCSTLLFESIRFYGAWRKDI